MRKVSLQPRSPLLDANIYEYPMKVQDGVLLIHPKYFIFPVHVFVLSEVLANEIHSLVFESYHSLALCPKSSLMRLKKESIRDFSLTVELPCFECVNSFSYELLDEKWNRFKDFRLRLAILVGLHYGKFTLLPG